MTSLFNGWKDCFVELRRGEIGVFLNCLVKETN